MAQYQSFPDTPGDSLSLEKLKRLSLPLRMGGSFLDVGCNEGFFCGFAKSRGVCRSVGLDASAGFIQRARERFPDCDFLAQSWDHLPDGEFDTILLASALHYAEDQPALIHRLVDKLAPDGVLVIELGIVSSSRDEWVRVKRDIDERSFPTIAKLRHVLREYAWKWMGPSVMQAGDPVARHVIHVRRRLPVAYLLMQPPGYGKTSIAASLFADSAVPVVAGDEILQRIASGEVEAVSELSELVKEKFSPFTIDQLVANLFEAGLGDRLVDVWLQASAGGDFVLDAYVPDQFQPAVQDCIRASGMLPVRLAWERVGAPPLSAIALDEEVERFYLSLSGAAAGDTRSAQKHHGPIGFVDEVNRCGNRLSVRGWAITGSGALPNVFAIRIGGKSHLIDKFKREQRPDVQRHLGLGHDLLGFLLEAPLDRFNAFDSDRLVEVLGGDDASSLGAPLAMAGGIVGKSRRLGRR